MTKRKRMLIYLEKFDTTLDAHSRYCDLGILPQHRLELYKSLIQEGKALLYNLNAILPPKKERKNNEGG